LPPKKETSAPFNPLANTNHPATVGGRKHWRGDEVGPQNALRQQQQEAKRRAKWSDTGAAISWVMAFVATITALFADVPWTVPASWVAVAVVLGWIRDRARIVARELTLGADLVDQGAPVTEAVDAMQAVRQGGARAP
jgi:hypothetical protein